MNVGDKLVCDNDHIYLIEKGNDSNDFLLVDESDLITNSYDKTTLEKYLAGYENEKFRVCIGVNSDNYLMYTTVIKII